VTIPLCFPWFHRWQYWNVWSPPTWKLNCYRSCLCCLKKERLVGGWFWFRCRNVI
jgi:hypothetical protein